MFRKIKPPTPVNARLFPGQKRSQPDKSLEKPLEFASIPLDRVGPPAESAPSGEKNLAAASLRSKQQVRLSNGAKAVIAKVEGSVTLVALRGRFPSVLNRLAQVWERPSEFFELVDSFLVDERGDRQGFPFDALQEITNLAQFYESHVAPRKGTLYDATQFRTRP